MAKLSIIVPVYQVKPYLERCLKSILSQTFTDYEVILVDDGSMDGSQDICDAYAEKYDSISVIHKQNGGLSSARNTGIDAASGEYLMFVDSDDLIHIRTMELEISVLEKHRADAFICPLRRFKHEEEISITSVIDSFFTKVVSGIEAERGLFNNPNVSKYVSSCGRLFKRSLFNGIRFPEGRLFEDEYVTYKLYYACERVVITNAELYFYYVNDTGITRNLNLNKRFDEYDAQMERLNFFKEKGEEELYRLSLLEFLRTAQWDLISYQKRNKDYNPVLGKRFQEQYKEVLISAEKVGAVSFAKNYDYYVLAYPEHKTSLRIKRQIMNLMSRTK